MLPHLELLMTLMLSATPQPATATTTTTTTTTTTVDASPAASTSPSPAPLAASSGMITGIITDDSTGTALDQATVVLECACLERPRQQTTDARGTFVFDGLDAGAYTLKVTSHGEAAVHEAPLPAGGLVEVAVTVADAPGPKPTESQAHRLSHDPDHDHDEVEHRHEVWGGLGVGLVFAPTASDGDDLSPTGNRITTNQLSPWTGAMRGVDLRWQTFTIDRHHFPRTIGYFRSGFARSSGSFRPGAEGFSQGQPTDLEVLTVPLFLGSNLYLFKDFPVRPYAGLGFGFDIMRLGYDRADAGRYVDVSARIGFEVHAGIEIRIANYLALTGEVMQLWSARRRFDVLPDVSNESFTALIGVTGAFPVRR